VIHEVLKHLYLPYVDKNITPQDIKSMFAEVEKLTRKYFKSFYAHGDIDYGKNLLIVKVAVLFIENFLKTEIAFLSSSQKDNDKLIIKHVEEKFTTKISVKTQHEELEVNLKGMFDRVDELKDQLRVIDYKTGFIKPAELKIEDIEELLYKPESDKSFQLLFYAYLFLKTNLNYHKAVVPGIITFRALSNGLLTLKFPNGDMTNEDIVIQFEAVLKQIISDIFNLDMPFSQTSDLKNCEYCPYIKVCSRG